MDVEEVERIAVLGAGTMGHGIAEVAAIAGFDVSLRDISEELVEEGIGEIEWSLDKLVENDQLDQGEADAARGRIEPVVDLADAVGDADVVIEAVPERMDVKREVYADLSAHAPERAILASNTSSLSITALAEESDRPERVCGMHFFNPPVRMDLVEVIRGDHTADDVIETVEGLAEAMGKTPVRVRKDSPGFVVNRVLLPMLNEAAWTLADDEATMAEIDSAVAYGLGLPMGAFELADQIGIDVTLDVLEHLQETLGEAYEPCPLFSERIEAGDLGRKSGAGFYDYDDGGAEIPPDAGREAVATRLVAVMANEVAELLAGDVADVGDIDRAMQLGAGFPEGPAAMADERGLDALRDALAERHEATGAPRYEPAPLLVEYADAGRGFREIGGDGAPDYGAISVERDGRVGRIVLDRPHRLNSITGAMLEELDDAVERLADDDAVRVLVITGAGDRAFSTGAELDDVTANFEPIAATEMSRLGQRVFGALEACDLPVVAGIEGYCLGGGMELATACDLRVAGEGATFGQPEHDLGLLPGWGGTQRLRHVVGEGRAREIVLTGEHYDAETMAEYGFVNEVVDDPEARALELARDLAAGPPLAQRYTKRAMLAGRGDVDAGLEVEAEAFGLLAGSADAREGVAAFRDDREPEFEGE